MTHESNYAPLTLDTTVRLRRGREMPLFGLGTWLSEQGGECRDAVLAALGHGYRLIDTATMYNNHMDVGAALKSKGVSSTFVVSKLSDGGHGYEEALKELDSTLQDLGVETLDLWLLHSPKAGRVVETWKAMLAARDVGKVASVGCAQPLLRGYPLLHKLIHTLSVPCHAGCRTLAPSRLSSSSSLASSCPR